MAQNFHAIFTYEVGMLTLKGNVSNDEDRHPGREQVWYVGANVF